jgi:hypothetical protein
MFVIDDRHGLWSLQVLHGFNADGSIRRGWYVKQIDEADAPTTVHVSSLMKLEDVEEFNRVTDPQTQVAMLRENKYRGGMVYAAVSGYDLGQLWSRMETAMNAHGATYLALSSLGEPHNNAVEETPEAPDERPQWQKAGFISKAAWIDAGRP